MGLYYRTEYRLGRRGGTVGRSYTGIRAFLAIAIDLFFVLTFDLVFGLVFFILRNILKLLTALFYLLTLPFHLARWVSHGFDRKSAVVRSGPHPTAPLKPAWPAFDEV